MKGRNGDRNGNSITRGQQYKRKKWERDMTRRKYGTKGKGKTRGE
jgi:hypothetical protein